MKCVLLVETVPFTEGRWVSGANDQGRNGLLFAMTKPFVGWIIQGLFPDPK